MDTGRLTGSPTVNRPVSIKHISEFKRMRHFSPFSAIVSALRERARISSSETSGLQVPSRPGPAVL
jgi:hypothetical protein